MSTNEKKFPLMGIYKNYTSQNLGDTFMLSPFPYHGIEISIRSVMREFYALMALGLCIKPIPFNHSHEKFIRDYEWYKNWFYTRLAKMMYDYISIICLGEIRHAEHESEKYASIDGVDESVSRSKIYYTTCDYTQNSILKLCEKLFNPIFNMWHRTYGGYNWYIIAKAGLQYNKIPHEVFIDHVFDLEHNTGNIFDKRGFIFGYYNISSLLDYKRYVNPCRLLKWAETYELQTLIERACNLGMIYIPFSEINDFVYTNGKCKIDFRSPRRNRYLSISEHRMEKYCNRFYLNEDKFFDQKNTYRFSLTELMDMYHPIKWGKEDAMYLPIYETGYKYDSDGCEISHPDRREREVV